MRPYLKHTASLLCFIGLIAFGVFAQHSKSDHGLFNNNWQEKRFTAPELVKPNKQQFNDTDVEISINPEKVLNKISNSIFGINATMYSGNYNTDSVFVNHVSNLQPSLIRFPGGDVSNMYFFQELPDDLPDYVLTYNGKWTDFTDGTEEISWKMNTAKYYAFLDSVESRGIITVNYPYARYGTSVNPVAKAASLAADWVRFDNGRTKYWEVGNETYACWEGGFRIDTTLNKDGQPEYVNGKLYGEHFTVFADSMRAAANKIGAEIYIGAVFADDDYIWDGSGKDITKNWNALLAPELRKEDGSCYADFISVHSYFLNKNEQTPNEVIDSYNVVEELQDYVYKKLDEADVKHVPLALSEWNIKEPHQTTQVAGLQLAATICKMQEIGFGSSSYFALKDHWGDKKGDFAMFSNNDPQVPNSEPYASFYHLYYLKQTLGQEMVTCSITPTNDSLLCFASKYNNGAIGMVVINKSQSNQNIQINVPTYLLNGTCNWHEISKFNDTNIWSEKIAINGVSDSTLTKGGPSTQYHNIPAYTQEYTDAIPLSIKGLSAVYVTLNKQNTN